MSEHILESIEEYGDDILKQAPRVQNLLAAARAAGFESGQQEMLAVLDAIWRLPRFRALIAKKVPPAYVWIHEDDVRRVLREQGITATGHSSGDGTGRGVVMVPYDISLPILPEAASPTDNRRRKYRKGAAGRMEL